MIRRAYMPCLPNYMSSLWVVIIAVSTLCAHACESLDFPQHFLLFRHPKHHKDTYKIKHHKGWSETFTPPADNYKPALAVPLMASHPSHQIHLPPLSASENQFQWPSFIIYVTKVAPRSLCKPSHLHSPRRTLVDVTPIFLAEADAFLNSQLLSTGCVSKNKTKQKKSGLGKWIGRKKYKTGKAIEWWSVAFVGDVWIYLSACSSGLLPLSPLPPPPHFLPHPCFMYTINYSTCSFHKLNLPLRQMHALLCAQINTKPS